MCGKWCDLGSHSYFCSTCIDEWSATFTAQQEQKSYAEEQNSYAEEQDSPRPLAVAGKLRSPEGEDQNKDVPQATLWSPPAPPEPETS
jgi:hypothetical protein